MFEYGKKNGWMGIALICLSVLPFIIALLIIPNMADSLPMRWDSAGEVTRWGSRYELFLAPVFALFMGLGTYVSASRKGRDLTKSDSNAAAILTVTRFLRSGILVSIVLNIANIYLLYTSGTNTPLIL